MYEFKQKLRYQSDGYYLESCSGDFTEILMCSLHDVLYIHHRVELVQDIKDQLVEDHAGY
jgi:hypothetical protein